VSYPRGPEPGLPWRAPGERIGTADGPVFQAPMRVSRTSGDRGAKPEPSPPSTTQARRVGHARPQSP